MPIHIMFYSMTRKRRPKEKSRGMIKTKFRKYYSHCLRSINIIILKISLEKQDNQLHISSQYWMRSATIMLKILTKICGSWSLNTGIIKLIVTMKQRRRTARLRLMTTKSKSNLKWYIRNFKLSKPMFDIIIQIWIFVH